MKKLSYLFGLMAMVVMMAMTSCKNVNEEVQKACDAIDNATTELEDATSLQDFMVISNDLQKSLSDLDTEVELTEDDKDALMESVMNMNKVLANKSHELRPDAVSDSELEKQIKDAEEELTKELAKCKTLGDALKF